MGRATLRWTTAVAVLFLLCGGAAQPALADAFNFFYDDAARFGLYGQQDNFTG